MHIKKIFKVEMAHRLVSSYSKRCQSFHGHSYTFEIILSSAYLDENSMVMDFGEVKQKLYNFIDSFDHSMVLFDEDPFTLPMVDIMNDGDMRYIIVPYNPTAEKMAEHICMEAVIAGLPVVSVKVNETLTGQAEYFHGEAPFSIDSDRVVFSAAVLVDWK